MIEYSRSKGGPQVVAGDWPRQTGSDAEVRDDLAGEPVGVVHETTVRLIGHDVGRRHCTPGSITDGNDAGLVALASHRQEHVVHVDIVDMDLQRLTHPQASESAQTYERSLLIVLCHLDHASDAIETLWDGMRDCAARGWGDVVVEDFAESCPLSESSQTSQSPTRRLG